jgi:hypothetical protein
MIPSQSCARCIGWFVGCHNQSIHHLYGPTKGRDGIPCKLIEYGAARVDRGL